MAVTLSASLAAINHRPEEIACRLDRVLGVMALPMPSSAQQPGNKPERSDRGTMPMTVTKFGLALAGLAFSATAALAQQDRLQAGRSSTTSAASSTNPSTRASIRAPRSSRRTPAPTTAISSPRTTPSASRRCAASPATASRPSWPSGFSQETALKKVAEEFPKTEVRHHRRGRREAERAVDRVQGA